MSVVGAQQTRPKSIFLRICDLIEPSCSSAPQEERREITAESISSVGPWTDTTAGARKDTTPATEQETATNCPECGKEYRTCGALKMHMRTHSPPCRCAHCGKSFSRPWLLKGHLRTHTGERPYECSECGRRFADRSNLRAHEHTHRSERRHRCAWCGQTFARGHVRARHEEACRARKAPSSTVRTRAGP